MKSILQLTLNWEPFGEIAIGKKTVEYRQQKPYWKSRLEGKIFNLIRFRNGYHTDAPEMVVEFRGLRKVKQWGERLYAIRLGRVLKIKRWKARPKAK